MNLTHLKYALEVERTGSITKAAKNLFTGQPNMSRVIKDLEDDAEIMIFSRTAKGIIPTENGRIFLEKAREIVRQSEELENLFKDSKGRRQSFRVAGQSSCSLLYAFERTAEILSRDSNYDCYIQECSSGDVLDRVLHDDCHIGIIKASSTDIDAFQQALWERNVRCQIMGAFRYVLVMHKDHPLAKKEIITPEMLEKYTLITSGGRRDEGGAARLVTFGSVTGCVGLLSRFKDSYMISRPLPRTDLDRLGLIMRPYEGDRGEMSDFLIYRSDHKLNDAETIFTEEFKGAYWDMNGNRISE